MLVFLKKRDSTVIISEIVSMRKEFYITGDIFQQLIGKKLRLRYQLIKIHVLSWWQIDLIASDKTMKATIGKHIVNIGWEA